VVGWFFRPFRRFRSSPVAGTAGLAAVVGALTGLGAVAFIEIISLFQRLFSNGGAKAFAGMGAWYVVLLPVIGGLIVVPLIQFLAPEAKGHGVPEVMTAIETRGGRIRPIIQIGAAVGSSIGQFLKIDRSRLLALIGAGAAGGIAATFNAPIAGVMFTIEAVPAVPALPPARVAMWEVVRPARFERAGVV
jgi:chloride channel protein, CIC family